MNEPAISPYKKRLTVRDLKKIVDPVSALVYDFKYKVVLLGNASVGKTCIIRRYKQEKFSMNGVSTIGVDFVNVVETVDGVRIQLQVWDTAGEERFRSLTEMWHRGSKGVVLVFDLTDNVSFQALKAQWLQMVQKSGLNLEQIVVMGNKLDLESERTVLKEEAEEFASKINAFYFETSAMDGTNVDEAFFNLAFNMKAAYHPFVQKDTLPANEPRPSSTIILKESSPSQEEKGKKERKLPCCVG